jgi:hypothetical protein
MARVRSLAGRFDAAGVLRVETQSRFREAVGHGKAISVEAVLWAVPIATLLFLVGAFARPVREVALEFGARVLTGAFVPVLIAGLAFLLVPIAVLMNFLREVHGGSRVVTATEFDVDSEAVKSRLVSGQLTPRDLVLENGHWRTLLESGEFGEVAEGIEALALRRRRYAMVLLVPLGMALIVFIGVVINELPDWIMRSAHD